LQWALLLVPVTGFAQAQSPPRITSAVSAGKFKMLPGSTHPQATPDRDRGRVPSGTPMQRMILVLSRSASQDAELRELVAAQKKPDSPAFHLGLTPEQFAQRFGPGESDLHAVNTWLQVQGFHIDAIARGRQWIEFSGNAGQVERAFHTQMHHYRLGSEQHVANASEISIPEALAPVVAGVLSLNDFRKQPMLTRAEKVVRNPATGQLAPVPDFTSGSGRHHLAPGDYAKLYDIAPLYAAGTDGMGVAIAIPGRTSIHISDMQKFREIFGLPPNDPLVINNGDAPLAEQNDEFESDLDLQWAGAVAPKATVKFVTSASTFVTDGIDLSNAYIVDNKVAPIVSVSYGLCEAFLGEAGNAFYAALYQQAAVEGITVFVASGDNGAAGCDAPEGFSPAQNGLAVNGLASTPYNVAVGGTQFDEGGNDATYWSATNALDFSSALGYIPEAAWNETCDPTLTPDLCSDYNLWSGSGGTSTLYAKPSWQNASGVPNDGMRDLPDVSLAAAGGHDGYLICNEGSCQTHVEAGVTILDSATSSAVPRHRRRRWPV
jgi:subtilase family serine protease